MKKTLFACAFLFFVFSGNLSAQGYEPHESWPFLYEKFQDGAARTNTGALVTEAPLNVSVADGSLIYINDKGIIMKADMTRIYTAKVGEDVYLNVGGKLYKVLSELDKGCVLHETRVDEDKLNNVNIGYGVSSSTASAVNISVLLDGRMSVINKSLEQTEVDKFNSAVLPVKENRYLYVQRKLIPATRSSVSGCEGVDKKEASAFIKKEKIKWKETASLEKLVIFLYDQLCK